MPRYFFDVHHGEHHGGFAYDDEGSEFASFEDARKEAKAILPEIARWEIPQNGDNQAFTLVVRDEDGQIVYNATLTFAGLRPN